MAASLGERIMEINWGLVAQVGVPIFCIILGFAINRLTERKARLIAYYGHVAVFRLAGTGGNPPNEVNTHSVIVRNVGGLAAHNVRVTHSYLPPNYHVHPQRTF